jgi:hypothetical protein
MSNKCKYHIILIFFLLYITDIPQKQHKINNEKIIYYNKDIKTNEINYKGEKIFKLKTLSDLSKIPEEYISDKEFEINRINSMFNLSHYYNDAFIKSELKSKMLSEISKMKNENITQLETFFLSLNINFGNELIAINNAIFYCEIVDCHTIILYENQSGRRWLINKSVFIKKLNITIMQGEKVDCEKNNILCFYESGWEIYYPKIVLPQVRTHLIKKEILNNLPTVITKRNDLYIHIRGGDIFQPFPHNMYSQPPLCFYEKILISEVFDSIYIISMDNSNVIVDTLIKKYPNIIHKKHSIEYDISLLCHAFNIAVSVSSFVFSAIKLNDNLEKLWEYDIMRVSEKFLFLHHHITTFNIKYKIYTMRPSYIYASKMFSWKGSSDQIKLMIEDNCPYDFVITKPNM